MTIRVFFIFFVGFALIILLSAAASASWPERDVFAGASLPLASPTPVTRPRTVVNTSAQPDLGPGASLHGKQIFPPDSPWNQDISRAPVDPNSDRIIASIDADARLHPDFGTVYRGAPNGIPYIVVAGSQPLVPIGFRSYGDQSDPGPYPIP